MRKLIMIGTSVAALAAFSVPADAASNRTLTEAAIGSAPARWWRGPSGAGGGGVVGAIVGGPRIGRGERVCWRDRHNRKHCRWR